MRRVLALAASAALTAIPAAGGAARFDYAAVALNVLPPGQSGDLLFPPTAKDQLRLYDGLTPLRGNVTPADLTRQLEFTFNWFYADNRGIANRPTFQQVITFAGHRPR